jgi:hypothetical protein
MKDRNDFDSFSVAVSLDAKDNNMPPLASATGNMQREETLRHIDDRLRPWGHRPASQRIGGRNERFFVYAHLRGSEVLDCPGKYRAIVVVSRRREPYRP